MNGMALLTDRFGSPIMNLTTKRPADLELTRNSIHVDLSVPDAVRAVMRGKHVTPNEAARLLWNTRAAASLDDSLSGWEAAPGVKLLSGALVELKEKKGAGRPKDLPELQSLAAKVAGTTWQAIDGELSKGETATFLNDLVLLFKYGTPNRQRPLRLLSDLYRLSQALLANPVTWKTRDGLYQLLVAPLRVPRVFTTPAADRGGAGPSVVDGGLQLDFDLSTPRAVSALQTLTGQLAELQRLSDALKVAQAAEDVAPDSGLLDRLMDVFSLGRQFSQTALRAQIENLRADIARDSGDAPHGKRFVRVAVGGFPIIIDVNESRVLDVRARKAAAARLSHLLPKSLLDQLASLNFDVGDLLCLDDLVRDSPRSPSYLRPAGRSDLLVVRQTTTGYRRAEIAYVENVLVGEKRTREHTSRVLSREEFFTGAETEVEETRDLQVTDSADLSTEVKNVVKEDLNARGTVVVTSRGPTVDVSATAELKHDSSREETAESVEKYARETVDRAVERTLTRTKQEARRLFEQETVEMNTHVLDGKGEPDHIRGVYQYLERVSRARIYRYGERELYDVLVPDPSALTWALAANRSDLGVSVLPPNEEAFAQLSVDNIHLHLERVIRDLRIHDIPPLPAEESAVDLPISITSGNAQVVQKELRIPDGYQATRADYNVAVEVESEDPNATNGSVVVADEVRPFREEPQNQPLIVGSIVFATPIPGPTIMAGLQIDNYNTVLGNIHITLQLTSAARRRWAVDAYSRVVARYEQQRRDYEQAIREAQAFVADPVQLPVGSRARLERITRTEMQRGAIDIMRNAPVNYDNMTEFPFTQPDGSLSDETHPVADLPSLTVARQEVQFLQQAFEWEHLSWVLYPYFWGERSGWRRKATITHPDPDFDAFLNAGAARVQIPVRPGFEALVRHYMETLEVYGGDGLPQMGDDGYLPFIDEQAVSLGEPGAEVPWPPDRPREWDVVCPTPLVLLRPIAEPTLPAWKPADGSEV
ncbi:hypothetical protein ACPW96_08455 [Micromonospora sp. DT81.3]|uniref:hypothetical protein n=1 Tax=Micromonospora sp. DT81.3 TaxID=3416523 RepID=UPI003CF720A1